MFSGTTLVAKTQEAFASEPAPGTNGIFGGFSDPIANSNGAVAFAGATGKNFDLGYWTNASGSLQLIAQNGGAAPGTNDTFLLRNSVTELGAFNAAGQVAFRALLTNGNVSGGLWTGTPGALMLVALDGQQAAGFPQGTIYSSVGFTVRLNSLGELVFYGTALVPNEGGPTVLWKGKPGALQVVVKSGDAAPDVADGAVFNLNTSESLGFNAAGEVAFLAALGSTQAIYAGAPGALRLVARTKSQAPGLEPGAKFTGLGFPAINAGGEVFFRGTYNSASVPSGQGLWVGRPGQLRLIAKEGDIAPETGGARYGTFAFAPLMLSDSGRVVFRAVLDSSSATDTGLFVTDKTGAVRLIARHGGSLGGSPPVTALDLQPLNAPPRGNGEGLPISIDANGQVVFSARWQNPGNGFDGTQAIFLAQFKEDVPPRKLWAAGRDLLANEKPDTATESSATNATVPEWSYGFRATAASTALTLFPPGIHVNNADGSEGWSGAAEGILWVNTKSEPIINNGGFGNLKPLYPAQVLMHPSNNFIVARWTAPADGAYRFVAKWIDLDNHGGNGATAHLVVNGTEEFAETFESTSVRNGKARLRAKTFNDMKAGDLVDFLVGSNGDNTFDSTAFNAVVVRVPKVTVTSPAGGTTITEGEDVIFAVEVDHAAPVTAVAIEIDGENIGSSFAPPYRFFFPELEPGTHYIKAIATDAQKVKASSAPIKITVTHAEAGAATVAGESGNGSDSSPEKVSAATAGGRTYYCVTSSGYWSNPTTWSPQGVPGSKDSVVIGPGLDVILHQPEAVRDVELLGRLIVQPGSTDFVAMSILGQLIITGGEIHGPLTLVITNPSGKLLVSLSPAILKDVELLNDGKVTLIGGGILTERSSLTNNGQLIVAPPPGLDQLAQVQVDTFINRGQTSIAANGQVDTNSSELISGNLALSNSSPLIGLDGATLIGNDGGTLIGNDGGSLIGLDGSTLVGNDGASLIGPDGNRLIGLDGATIITHDGASIITHDGASITGTGEIRGNLVNQGGFILPGNSPGGILINGNYTQESAATLLLEIGGTKTTPFQYDIFQVTGTANLGGNLIVRTIDGYTPASGDAVSPLLYTSHTGSFDNVSSNAQITFGADGAQISVSGPNPPAPKALNIATRMRVETGDNVLIAGFIITGSQPKKVIIRGIGPSLPVPGALADPTLELDAGAVTNDDWRTNQEQEIIATTIPPSSNLESAIVATLDPGLHTAILRGKDGTTGIGVVEVYDLDSGAPSTLANISSRGFVQTDDNVMIGGFIIGGNYPAKVLIRAIGPSLAAFGLQGALEDTELELHDSNGSTITNDDWRSTQEAEITLTTIPPSNDKESAILAILTPGNYTAVVRGKNNTTGIAVVEAYNIQ